MSSAQNDFSASRLSDYQLVIVNNWDLEAASPQLQRRSWSNT